jgi:hypothetical protein
MKSSLEKVYLVPETGAVPSIAWTPESPFLIGRSFLFSKSLFAGNHTLKDFIEERKALWNKASVEFKGR